MASLALLCRRGRALGEDEVDDDCDDEEEEDDEDILRLAGRV